MTATESADEQLTSVTLTGDEFKELMDKQAQLTAEMAETDAINAQMVKQIMDLEHANSVLAARVNRLRDRIGQAYDVLSAARNAP